MLGVLIEGIRQALMSTIMSIGSNQHEHDLFLRNGQALLPAIVSEILIQMLDGGMRTTMTSKACVIL
jgi:hypothetical protein